MAFKFDQLNLRALAALPVDAKKAFPEKIDKWNALNDILIQQVKDGTIKSIKIDDKVFDLKERK